MRLMDYQRINEFFSEEAQQCASVSYLTEKLNGIVRPGENVLICFPRKKTNELGALLEKAVQNCGGGCVFWEEDLRWKTLVRLAFVSKASVVIGYPLVVLGLSKIAAHEGIPLYIYDAVLAGYPCIDWVMDGIIQGLDCRIWGIFGSGSGSMLGGFSCTGGRGVHIREDVLGVELLDAAGNPVLPGEQGNIVVYSRHNPEIRFRTRASGRWLQQPCSCGQHSPKLVSIGLMLDDDHILYEIAQKLLFWSSILECRLSRTECGLEIEIICFQGQQLPEIPSCAKLVVRTWNPETDIPMSVMDDLNG